MNAVAKTLLSKSWKNEDADLPAGRHYIDEEFIVRISGNVEKLEDELVAPTVSIPLIPALALFWDKAGIARDQALTMPARGTSRGHDRQGEGRCRHQISH